MPGVRRGAFKYLLRDQAIHFAAGELLQQLGAFVGAGMQKGGKTALRQQHGFGKAGKVQAGQRFDLAQFVVYLAGQDFTVGTGQLHFGRLQRAAGFVAGAALAPEGAVGHAAHFKLHFGQTVGGVAGHQLVAPG